MSGFLAVTALDFGGNYGGSLLGMILEAGGMVQFVLALLLLFSVVSWAIILMKYRVVRKTKKENDQFLDVYMKSSRLSDIFPETRKFRSSTLAEVFRAGYVELGKLGKSSRNSGASGDPVDGDIPSVELVGIDNVERALNRAASQEASKLESTLGFLATTGSACPFIGLFGTVWGIMNAFRGIGFRGSATLAVVAPGISEALVATAAGLAAAIPAVIFYNYYLSRIRVITQEMDNFSSEFLNIIERHYIRK
ncbi:MAG TPA: protein TolQ [Syntrophales bacterium]|jgi:biopolymer transport protein TolQ|nr:protein TolQ [Syntrophales bacterium]HRT60954.1 protein TolQ [Syntrophales bacterium]